MRILAIGDIVGRPGRKILKELLPKIKKDHKIDFCIANGENAATGNGITYKVTRELYSYGVDVITLGNHTWAKKEIHDFIDNEECMIRPANMSGDFPGRGSTIIYKGNMKLGVVNICGKTYFTGYDCPFKCVENEIEKLKRETNSIVIDFHAETTSEKVAMGWFLDGKASLVFGTHTHVQTADERILPNGTGYITDIGMTGPYNSVLGVKKEIIIDRFISGNTARFEIDDGEMQINGICFEIDNKSGHCISIERVRYYLK